MKQAWNPSLDSERLRIAADPETTQDTLDFLSEDTDDEIRFAVATNPNTRLSTIKSMTIDQDPDCSRIANRVSANLRPGWFDRHGIGLGYKCPHCRRQDNFVDIHWEFLRTDMLQKFTRVKEVNYVRQYVGETGGSIDGNPHWRPKPIYHKVAIVSVAKKPDGYYEAMIFRGLYRCLYLDCGKGWWRERQRDWFVDREYNKQLRTYFISPKR